MRSTDLSVCVFFQLVPKGMWLSLCSLSGEGTRYAPLRWTRTGLGPFRELQLDSRELNQISVAERRDAPGSVTGEGRAELQL
jgi:hypothetical protein